MAEFFESLALAGYLTDQLGGNYSRLLADVKAHHNRRESREDGLSSSFSAFEERSPALKVPLLDLARFDRNITRHEARMATHRPGFELTYFQRLACLYLEMYLSALVEDGFVLAGELEKWRRQRATTLTEYDATDLRKFAYWMATGSGKTLLLHVNLHQFAEYRLFEPDNIILLTPSELLTHHHLEYLAASGIPARYGLDAPSLFEGVVVLEITKLFVDGGGSAQKGGVSIPTSLFEGPNLVLVDEGHKGTASRSEAETERAWRNIRNELVGINGFALEYSATFAQIMSANDELQDEYGKCIGFDFSYARFWRDGYGKDFRVTNLKHAGVYDQDELLLASQLVSYEQTLFFDDHPEVMSEYGVKRPLSVFVGQHVTAGNEVLDVARFFARMSDDRTWAVEHIGRLLTGTSSLPAGLFTHQFSLLSARDLPADAVYDDLCNRILGGGGAISAQLLRRADGEIGLKSAGGRGYFAVINVSDATGLLAKLATAGVEVGEDDFFSQSVFESLNTDRGNSVTALIGSKKFVEGWSSWRVSVMVLLRVGKSAGPQIIQLFGRGVRLQGREVSLKRSRGLPGEHPPLLPLVETLHVFGLTANYMEAFEAAIRTEGIHAVAQRELRVNVVPHVDDLGLLTLETNDDGSESVLHFDPTSLVVAVDVVPTFSFGGMEGMASADAADAAERAIPVQFIDIESAYYAALRHKATKGWSSAFVTRDSIRTLLTTNATLRAPTRLFHPSTSRDYADLQHAAEIVVRKAVDRFVYRERRRHETAGLSTNALTRSHPNFPRSRPGARHNGYRLEVPTDLLAAVDRVISLYDQGKGTEDLTEPLPRLHVDVHLYDPMLTRDAELHSLRQLMLGVPSSVLCVPTGLVPSEVQFVRDLREAWAISRNSARFADCRVYLLRNLPRRGIGFFGAAGFFPDFLLWLKYADRQVLGFIEPKGMVNWPEDKIELLSTLRTLSVGIPLRGFVVTPTPLDAIGAIGGHVPTADRTQWLKERNVLLQSDPDYVTTILAELLTAASGTERAASS